MPTLGVVAGVAVQVEAQEANAVEGIRRIPFVPGVRAGVERVVGPEVQVVTAVDRIGVKPDGYPASP